MKRLVLYLLALGLVNMAAWAQTSPVFCPVTMTGSQGVSNGQFNQPNGAAIYGTNLYISDFMNNRVEAYSTSLGFNFIIGAGQLGSPGQVAVDGQGYVYVTNQSSADNVMVFNPANPNTPVLTFGGPGTLLGQFQNPIGIVVDSSGYIYVSDFSDRIQKFTSGGVPVTQWGGAGSGGGQFNSPDALAIDSSNNLYVADTNNYLIQKFTLNGIFLAQFGSHVTGLGQFEGPWGVAIGPCGYVYATDRVANFIEVFSPAGTPLYQYGISGSGSGQFSGVMGIAFDASNNLFTTEYLNNRVQEFTSCGLACGSPPPSGSNAPGPGEAFVYPSPARGAQASLCYDMAAPGRMDLKIRNEAGELADEVQDRKPAGVQVTPFSVASFATGVYFYQVTLAYDSAPSVKLAVKKFAVLR